MKLTGKGGNAVDSRLLLELYNKDPSIFNQKRPGGNKINNQFIDKVINGLKD
jgi:hypothetical protein